MSMSQEDKIMAGLFETFLDKEILKMRLYYVSEANGYYSVYNSVSGAVQSVHSTFDQARIVARDLNARV